MPGPASLDQVAGSRLLPFERSSSASATFDRRFETQALPERASLARRYEATPNELVDSWLSALVE